MPRTTPASLVMGGSATEPSYHDLLGVGGPNGLGGANRTALFRNSVGSTRPRYESAT